MLAIQSAIFSKEQWKCIQMKKQRLIVHGILLISGRFSRYTHSKRTANSRSKRIEDQPN